MKVRAAAAKARIFVTLDMILARLGRSVPRVQRHARPRCADGPAAPP
jgi:hypothetical protein